VRKYCGPVAIGRDWGDEIAAAMSGLAMTREGYVYSRLWFVCAPVGYSSWVAGVLDLFSGSPPTALRG
jgi:hypothetical protein